MASGLFVTWTDLEVSSERTTGICSSGISAHEIFKIAGFLREILLLTG